MAENRIYPQYAATDFPEKVQELITYTDLTQNDLEYYKLYRAAIDDCDFVSAKNYLALIESGDDVHKAISAGELNKLIDTVNALQMYMTDEGWQQMVEITQSEWEAIINQFSYIGDWDSSNTYSKWNMVTYATSRQGQDQTKYLYIALQDISSGGINPFDDVANSGGHWFRLTIRGVQGSSGSTGTFQGAWDSTTTYVINDVVTHDGIWWYSLQGSNYGQEPAEGSAYWSIFLEPKLRQYPVTSDTPTSQEVGDLWFEVL